MRIAIITNFMEMNPGYSLVGIVQDQIKMLSTYGNRVDLLVNSQYNNKYDQPMDATLHKVMPFLHLIDYDTKNKLTAEHALSIREIENAIENVIVTRDIEVVFTHDLVYTGWNLPYALAIQNVSRRLTEVRWLHWIHSVPNIVIDGQFKPRDWWYFEDYGPKHKLIFPNRTELRRVQEAWRTRQANVRCVPHIKDPRTWYDFSELTNEFIIDYPGMMTADVVQVYPASTDRLTAKGVDKVIKIFSHIKKQGKSVCLVIANQWATGRQRKEDVNNFLNFAHRCGLNHAGNEEVIFTSEYCEDTSVGISKRMLRELQLCSNLFIFPTMEESFGLVGPEAAMPGCLIILNRSLTMMFEIFESFGLYFDFGSFHNQVNIPPEMEDNYYRDIAAIIISRMQDNEAIMTKTICRQRYNYDSLYKYCYFPLLKESETWV